MSISSKLKKCPPQYTADGTLFALWHRGQDLGHYPPQELPDFVPDWLDDIRPVSGCNGSMACSGTIDTSPTPATVLHLVLCALKVWTSRVADTLLALALEGCEASEDVRERRLVEVLDSVLDSRGRGYHASALWTLEQGLVALTTATPAAPPTLTLVGEESVTVYYKVSPDAKESRFTCGLSEALRIVQRPAAGVAAMRIKSALESHPVVVAELVKSAELMEEADAVAGKLTLLASLSHHDHDGGWGMKAHNMGRALRAAMESGTSGEVMQQMKAGARWLMSVNAGLAKRIHATFVGLLTDHPEAMAEIGHGEALRRVRAATLAKLKAQWKSEAAARVEYSDDEGRWLPTANPLCCPITPAPAMTAAPGPFEAPSTAESRRRFNRASRQARERFTVQRRGAAGFYHAVEEAQATYGRPAPVATPYTALAPGKELERELVWYKIDGRYELLGCQHNAHVRSWLAEANALRAATLQLLAQDYPELVAVEALVGPPCMCPLCGHELLAEVNDEYLCAACIMGGALNQ